MPGAAGQGMDCMISKANQPQTAPNMLPVIVLSSALFFTLDWKKQAQAINEAQISTGPDQSEVNIHVPIPATKLIRKDLVMYPATVPPNIK
tara:strand:- start:69094 stop:69366 length:273 start_codon:yes stop_codon:yes gene_type:complete